jgi:selenocysteine-specific elongation factor
MQPPPSNGIDAELLGYLEAAGEIVRVAEGLHFDPAIHNAIADRVRAALAARGEITLAEVRDLLGTSRKYAQAILEDLDQRRVTRRVGDVRLLRETANEP